jgi:RND family efflux transporter MFP subunit
MTPLRQGLLSIVAVAVAAGGWYTLQQRDQIFGSSPSASPAAGIADKATGSRGSAVIVVPAQVTMEAIGERLNALGTATAAQAITLYPQSVGLISGIDIHGGDHVDKGAVLVRLDDRDERITVDKAKIALADALRTRDRANQLAKSQTGTQVDLSNAQLTLDKAETDLRSAQLALDRRTIAAPFAGVVGLTTRSVGEVVAPTTPVATLDDLSALTVAFDAPQRFVALIKAGGPVTATAEGLPGIIIKGSVTAVDSRLDETARTFKVRATLTEGINGLKPGMATVVSLTFAGTPQALVSSSAVLWDREGSYVWKLDGNVARRVAVQILGRHSGTVAVAGEIREGDEVAVEGLQRLRDGVAVTRAADLGSGTGAPGSAPLEKRPNITSDTPSSAPAKPTG